MKLYAVKCPCCGTINKVYLEETDGWMECENCLHRKNALFVNKRGSSIAETNLRQGVLLNGREKEIVYNLSCVREDNV